MDHLSKDDTEEMITSWSKQCFFSHREGVVDKEKLYCSFVSWSGQDINSVFLHLRSVVVPGKHFHFLKKLTKHSKGKNVRSSVVLESI